MAELAGTVDVALVSAEHRPVEEAPLEQWRNGQASLLAGHGGPYDDLFPHPVFYENAAMAAAEHIVLAATVELIVVAAVAPAAFEREALWRDAVGRNGGEHDLVEALEESKEGRLPVVRTETVEEPGVGGDAPPPLADCGGAWQGGRPETEKDLLEEIVVVRQGGRRHQRAAAATAAGKGS